MNEIVALRRKRLEGSGQSGEPVEAEGYSHEGEMSEYWKKIQDMDAKIDQILEILSPTQEGQEVQEK